jgi:hypothetical protein
MVNGRLPAAARPGGIDAAGNIAGFARLFRWIALESNARKMQIIQILRKTAAHLI